jgi:hypothetical protein
MTRANGFVLALMFLFPSLIFAETGEEVCNSISFSRVREECLSLIQGRYYDRDAGYVCYRARFNDGKYDCVRISLDKEYTPSESYTCDEFSSDDERIACMRTSGRQRDEDDLPSEKLRIIYSLSASAIEKLYEGDIDGAITTLQRIKRISSSSK